MLSKEEENGWINMDKHQGRIENYFLLTLTLHEHFCRRNRNYQLPFHPEMVVWFKRVLRAQTIESSFAVLIFVQYRVLLFGRPPPPFGRPPPLLSPSSLSYSELGLVKDGSGTPLVHTGP